MPTPCAGEIGGQEEQAILRLTIEQVPPRQARGRASGKARWQPTACCAAWMCSIPPMTPTWPATTTRGWIPIKLLGGWEAVNVTIGLPFIRTSVSHGTAPDIVGQGVASPDSLIAAIEQAQHLATRQQLTQLTQGDNTTPMMALLINGSPLQKRHRHLVV
ncbi:MAG: 4-hydroxythreonine-4-phosphate dehydrogenase PdxA [Vampirovibrionales bacterium]